MKKVFALIADNFSTYLRFAENIVIISKDLLDKNRVGYQNKNCLRKNGTPYEQEQNQNTMTDQ